MGNNTHLYLPSSRPWHINVMTYQRTKYSEPQLKNNVTTLFLEYCLLNESSKSQLKKWGVWYSYLLSSQYKSIGTNIIKIDYEIINFEEIGFFWTNLYLYKILLLWFIKSSVHIILWDCILNCNIVTLIMWNKWFYSYILFFLKKTW